MRKITIIFGTAAMMLLFAFNGDELVKAENIQNNDSINIDEIEISSVDELNEIVMQDVENKIAALREKYDKLITDIDTYEKYFENVAVVEEFYNTVYEDTKTICIRMREWSMKYARFIIDSDSDKDDKYDELEELYDTVYEDTSDEIYDEIYDGILDDIYDVFYDEILDDAYDYMDYEQWSDARSEEYDWWSDTRSDVYDEWSDTRSDVYEFWSDMRSEVWDADFEKAEKKMDKFQKDIDKLKEKEEPETEDADSQADVSTDEIATEEIAEETEETEATEATENADLVDGMRPEFKEAMDSYEEFYNDYCEFMKKFNENPTDAQLLVESAEMLTNVADMDEKFNAWENEEMNDAELSYYMEVHARILQKLAEVTG